LVVGEPIPAFDYHCPLMSLPHAFSTTLDTIPARFPYLGVSPKHSAMALQWKARLAQRINATQEDQFVQTNAALQKDTPVQKSKINKISVKQSRPLRIGLAWSGNPAHKNDHHRSIPLAEFYGLIFGTQALTNQTLVNQTEDSHGTGRQADFFCLQNEIRETDAVILQQQQTIHYLGQELADFTDTAGLIANMDLVVSVDTSIAHLAGAMGKPLWLILPFNADWRWLLERSDSPWYPHVQIFRQQTPGDWKPVMQQVVEAISVYL